GSVAWRSGRAAAWLRTVGRSSLRSRGSRMPRPVPLILRLHFHQLRTYEDDDRCEVDPGEQACRERDRAVRAEDPDGAGEKAERDLRDLPQHGRYQRRAADDAAA